MPKFLMDWLDEPHWFLVYHWWPLNYFTAFVVCWWPWRVDNSYLYWDDWFFHIGNLVIYKGDWG